MKLRRLAARAFGHFADLRPLEFRTRGLQMIFGLNEAGKSTLLALLRGMLFEFDKQDPYIQDGFAAQLQAELADGRQVDVVRKREKRKLVLEATLAGEPRSWTQAELNRLWGGVTAETFGKSYAFGLEECQQTKGLVGLQAGIGGGIFGGFEPQELLEALRNEHEAIFKPRSSKPPLNHARSRIEELAKQVRAAQLTAGRYDELQQQVDAAAAAAGLARERLQDAELRCSAAQAFERWRTAEGRREACVAQGARLRVPPGLPVDAAEQFQQALAARRNLAEQLQQRRQEQERDRRELAGLAAPSGLCELGPQVADLMTRVEALAGARRDLPERQAQLQAQRAQLQRQLGQLGLRWTADEVAAFLPDLAQRQAYERLVQRRQANERALELAAKGQADAQSRQWECERELAELGPAPDTHALASFLERQPEYEAALRALQDAETRSAGLRASCSELVRELTPPGPGAPSQLAGLSAPPVEEIQRWVAEEADLAERLRVARQETERLARRGEQQRRELQAAKPAGQALPTREELAQQRGERDRLLAGRVRDPAADDDWAERVAAAVAQADATADRLFENAALVAKAEQLAAHEREQAAALQQEQAAAGALADFQQRWQTLWAPCGLPPLAPAAMLAWRRRLTTLREQLAAAAEGEAAAERLRSALAEATTAGRRLLAPCEPDPEAGAPTDVRVAWQLLLARAKQAVRQAELLAGKRQDLLQQFEQARRETQAALAEQTQLQQEQAALAAQWSGLLAQWRLPSGGTPEFVRTALDEIKHAQRTLQACDDLQHRIDLMQTALTEAESLVRPLCAAQAPDLHDLPVELAIRQLQTRCEEAQAQADRRAALQRDLRLREAEFPAWEAQLAEADRRLAAWLQRGGVRDEDEFLAAARQAPQAADLRAQADQLAAQGAVHKQQAGALAADEAWLACSAEELQRRVADLERERDDLKRQYDAAQQALGRAQEEFHACQEERGAAQAQAELESARADLVALVEQYAPLKLAHSLLERFLQRFAREGQADLLASAGEIFRRLTGGGYRGLQYDPLAGPEAVHAARHDGRTLPPERLSTGTQEQLYLANRLAYATRLNSVQEPLPIVLDDVLANFDADRARRALSVLHELADAHQVLFFTCHAHLVELAREVGAESDTKVEILSL